MTLSSSSPAPRALLTSAGRAWRGLHADFLHVPRGLLHAPAGDTHRLGIHFGPPVKADCRCDGQRMRRLQKPGDIDIVPAGVDGSWEDDGDCQILRLSLHPSLLRTAAEELGRGARETELLPRFQVRDTRIEAIGWAIKADLEAITPSDPLYIDLLASALAVRLLETASASSGPAEARGEPRLSARQLRILTDFIESNLGQTLRLAELSAVAGVGITQLKALFRNSTGMPVHRYVIRRRVELARTLLTTTAMPASEVAVAAGFAHQSHMASTMRRVLGETPRDIVRRRGEFRPKLQKPD